MTDDKTAKLSDLIELWHAEPLNHQQLILLTTLLLMERKEVIQQLASAREELALTQRQLEITGAFCTEELTQDDQAELLRRLNGGCDAK